MGSPELYGLIVPILLFMVTEYGPVPPVRITEIVVGSPKQILWLVWSWASVNSGFTLMVYDPKYILHPVPSFIACISYVVALVSGGVVSVIVPPLPWTKEPSAPPVWR